MAESNSSAIPTRYNNNEYRSRIEARWAAWFDMVGWSFEYEPIDLPGWIPDFIIKGKKFELLVEVKSSTTLDAFDFKKMRSALKQSGNTNEILLLGRNPLLPLPDSEHTADHRTHIGWLWGPEMGLAWEEGCEYDYAPGPGIAVEHFQRLGIAHYWSSYQDRITDGYDGNLSLGPCYTEEVIDSLWKQAGNITRWRRPNVTK